MDTVTGRRLRAELRGSGRRWALRWVIFLGLASCLSPGCTQPMRTQRFSAFSAQPLRRIVVFPLEPGSAAVSPRGAEVVTSRVLDALAEDDTFEVISPVDVAIVEREEPEDARAEVLRLFTPDALLRGVVERYDGRDGLSGTPQGPSAVTFDLRLESPDGIELWVGRYDERQQGLSEDLGALGRWIRRRFRWVPPERLAAYGARILVADLVRGRRRLSRPEDQEGARGI